MNSFTCWKNVLVILLNFPDYNKETPCFHFSSVLQTGQWIGLQRMERERSFQPLAAAADPEEGSSLGLQSPHRDPRRQNTEVLLRPRGALIPHHHPAAALLEASGRVKLLLYCRRPTVVSHLTLPDCKALLSLQLLPLLCPPAVTVPSVAIIFSFSALCCVTIQLKKHQQR